MPDIDKFVAREFKQRAIEGQRGSDILQAEKHLSKRGYKRAKPDGLFTHNTTIAVKKLQRDYGLKATSPLAPPRSSTSRSARMVT